MLVSPLASGFRVLFGVGDSSSALYGMLDRLFCPLAQDIEGVAQPVFLLHGLQDDIIDIRNAYEIQKHVPVRCLYPPLKVRLRIAAIHSSGGRSGSSSVSTNTTSGTLRLRLLCVMFFERGTYA